MGRWFLVLMLVAGIPGVSWGGGLTSQFGSGYGGIAWGTSLNELVAQKPGGDQMFANGAGERLYAVPNEEPLFGISRTGMKVYYALDKGNEVRGAWIMFPYKLRERLLGMLNISFGPVQSTRVKGIRTIYYWPQDNGMTLTLEATLDPSYGILALTIARPR